MAEKINDNFDLLAALPIRTDDRKDTINGRDNIPMSKRYTGRMCFVNQTDTLYILIGGIENTNWVALGSANTSNPVRTFNVESYPFIWQKGDGNTEDIMQENDIILFGFANYDNGTGSQIALIEIARYKSGDPSFLSSYDVLQYRYMYKTFVGSGQSNMLGKHSGGDMTTDPRVFVWREDLVPKSWQVADLTQPPFNGNNNLLFQFGKKYAQENNTEVRLILNAADWQDIERWLDTSPTMWTDLTNQITNSGTTNVDIMLWHQGEANYNNLTVSEYAAKVDALLTKVRGQSWSNEDMPFISGELLNVYPQQNGFYQNIRFNDWIKDKNFTVAQANDLSGEVGDEIHFSGPELELLGKDRYWSAYKSISEQYTPLNKGFFKRLNNRISIGENAGEIDSPDFDPNLYINGGSIVPLLIEREGTIFNILQQYANTGLSPHFEIRKARGTKSTPLPVLNNDDLGDFTAYGHDGSGFDKACQIIHEASEDWTTTAQGSRLVFSVKENGTVSLIRKFIIENDGTINAPETNIFKLNSGSNKNLINKEYADIYYKKQIINTSTPQTSVTLNASFPNSLYPVGTQVLNLDSTERYIYTKITSTTWRRSELLTDI